MPTRGPGDIFALRKIMRFYVDNVYIPPGGADCKEVDYCRIGYATADMEDYDGMNWVGKEDFAKFNLKDSLYDAIRHAGMIADKIQFIDLNADDLREAHAIVKQLMKDDEYLRGYGRKTPATPNENMGKENTQ